MGGPEALLGACRLRDHAAHVVLPSKVYRPPNSPKQVPKYEVPYYIEDLPKDHILDNHAFTVGFTVGISHILGALDNGCQDRPFADSLGSFLYVPKQDFVSLYKADIPCDPGL